MQELSQALIAMNTLKQSLHRTSSSDLSISGRLSHEQFPIHWTIFRYESDETLVFYQADSAVIVHSILPVNQTQALHPLPYDPPANDDEETKKSVWKEQIYVAAWNGLVLGYPPHFVKSYCVDFHTPLELEYKNEEYEKALADHEQFLLNSYFFSEKKHFRRIQSPEIQFGYNKPLEKPLLLRLIEFVNENL